RDECEYTPRGLLELSSVLPVALRVVAPESWGAALHYYTGSKAHNIRVRRLGIERGLKINEYGVFRADEGKRKGAGKKGAKQKAKSHAGGDGRGGGGRSEERRVGNGGQRTCRSRLE